MFLALPLLRERSRLRLMQVGVRIQNTVTTLSCLSSIINSYPICRTNGRLQRFLDAIENVGWNADGKMVSSSGGRALRANKLSYGPGWSQFVAADEFSVEKGEAVWLSGASGSKSTFLKALAQLWRMRKVRLSYGPSAPFPAQQSTCRWPLMAAAVYPPIQRVCRASRGKLVAAVG